VSVGLSPFSQSATEDATSSLEPIRKRQSARMPTALAKAVAEDTGFLHFRHDTPTMVYIMSGINRFAAMGMLSLDYPRGCGNSFRVIPVWPPIWPPISATNFPCPNIPCTWYLVAFNFSSRFPLERRGV
jgi:hypothetical protein